MEETGQPGKEEKKMNRAQRRQMNRENGTEVKSLTYTLKASDIQKIKDDAAREAVDSLEKTSYRLAVDRSFVFMLAFSIIVLMDKYKFGKRKLSNYADHVLEHFDDFQNGLYEYSDLQQTLKDEAGIDVIQKAQERGIGIITDEEADEIRAKRAAHVSESNDTKKVEEFVEFAEKTLLDGSTPTESAMICMEEFAELSQVTSKWARYEGNRGETEDQKLRAHLIEELADTAISFDLIKKLAGIDGGEVSEEVVAKLAKDVKRMEKRRNEADNV